MSIIQDLNRMRSTIIFIFTWLTENYMTKSTGGQINTCKKCSTPRVLYPPGPEYKHLILEPCEEGDSIESTFECLNCGEINKIYWDKGHVSKV
jgi:hypothetical protein